MTYQKGIRLVMVRAMNNLQLRKILFGLDD